MLQHHLGCRVPSPNLLHLAGMMKHSDTPRRRAQQNPIRPSAQCCTDKSPAKATLSSSRCKGMLNQDNARHHHWQFRNFSTPLNIQNIWHKFQKAFHLAFKIWSRFFFKFYNMLEILFSLHFDAWWDSSYIFPIKENWIFPRKLSWLSQKSYCSKNTKEVNEIDTNRWKTIVGLFLVSKQVLLW